MTITTLLALITNLMVGAMATQGTESPSNSKKITIIGEIQLTQQLKLPQLPQLLQLNRLQGLKLIKKLWNKEKNSKLGKSLNSLGDLRLARRHPPNQHRTKNKREPRQLQAHRRKEQIPNYRHPLRKKIKKYHRNYLPMVKILTLKKLILKKPSQKLLCLLKKKLKSSQDGAMSHFSE